MINLYHGSIAKFDNIDINKGKGYKDFGKGFYATKIASHAEKIALRNKKIAEKLQSIIKAKNSKENLEPIKAYRYNLLFNEKLDDLSVKIFNTADVEWLRFIIMNRKCESSAHDYDIVIGPTADAETVTIINENLDELENTNYNEELCQKVIENLKVENLPKQYFFRTSKAIKTLTFDALKRQVLSWFLALV